MKAIVFTTRAAMLAVLVAIRNRRGMPIGGCQMGSGVFGPDVPTRWHRRPFKHPTLQRWAIPCDDEATKETAIAQLSGAVDLDGTWLKTLADGSQGYVDDDPDV